MTGQRPFNARETCELTHGFPCVSSSGHTSADSGRRAVVAFATGTAQLHLPSSECMIASEPCSKGAAIRRTCMFSILTWHRGASRCQVEFTRPAWRPHGRPPFCSSVWWLHTSFTAFRQIATRQRIHLLPLPCAISFSDTQERSDLLVSRAPTA